MKNHAPLGRLLLSALALFGATGNLFAQEATPTVDSGDTAWMLTSTVLVLLMTLPGLALFYGGLVRAKNVLSVLVQCVVIAAVMSILWVVFGYSLAAGEGNKFFGDGSKLMLRHLTADGINGSDSGECLDHLPDDLRDHHSRPHRRRLCRAHEIFRGAYFHADLDDALLSARMAYGLGRRAFQGLERSRLCRGHRGAHQRGNRRSHGLHHGRQTPGIGEVALTPHSVPFTVIGAALLWVGWFGFNAGSAAGANASAGFAMITTQIATAAAVLAWLICEKLISGKATAVGAATGAVAGLVAITPASGSTTVGGALVIGILSGVVCYVFATRVKRAFGYDDSLDVFGVHGIGGIIGAILTGVFLREGASELSVAARFSPSSRA